MVWEGYIDEGKGQNGETNRLYRLRFTYSCSSTIIYEMILNAHYIHIPLDGYLLFKWWIPNGYKASSQARVSL